MEKKLNVENAKLKTTIEEKNYRICKKILTENLCKSGKLFVRNWLEFTLKQFKPEIGKENN